MLSLYCYPGAGRMLTGEVLEQLDSGDRIVLPFSEVIKGPQGDSPMRKKMKERNLQLWVWLPGVSLGFYDGEIRKMAKSIRGGKEPVFDGVYVGNPGQIKMLEDCAMPLFGDEPLNVCNSAAAAFWEEQGLEGTTLSYECGGEETGDFLWGERAESEFQRRGKADLQRGIEPGAAQNRKSDEDPEKKTGKDLEMKTDQDLETKKDEGLEAKTDKDPEKKTYKDREMKTSIEREKRWEILVYGRIPVMFSELCPLAAAAGKKGPHCGLCREKGTELVLQQERKDYPLLLNPESCQSLILSDKPLRRKENFLHGKKECIRRIALYRETEEEILKLCKTFRKF